MPPHPHDYPTRHAHGELDMLVVGAAITGRFRPSPDPVVAPQPRPLGIIGRKHCPRCGYSHDIYGIEDQL